MTEAPADHYMAKLNKIFSEEGEFPGLIPVREYHHLWALARLSTPEQLKAAGELVALEEREEWGAVARMTALPHRQARRLLLGD